MQAKQVNEPPKISTIHDVKNLLNSFIPKNKSVETITTNIDTINSDGKKVTVSVSAPLSADYYNQLVDGMKIIKTRMDVADKYQNAKALILDGPMWVDIIVKNQLGGVREGYRVRWDVAEGIVYYDPISGKVTQCERSST